MILMYIWPKLGDFPTPKSITNGGEWDGHAEFPSITGHPLGLGGEPTFPKHIAT